MYTHYTMSVEAAKYRQRDLLAQADRERRIRKLQDSAAETEPTGARTSRRSRRLPLLRPQTQS